MNRSLMKAATSALLMSSALTLAAVVLPGCGRDTGYPVSLEYPLRSDLLLSAAFLTDVNRDHPPAGFERPGQIEALTKHLVSFDGGQKGDKKEKKVFDPAALTPDQRGELEVALRALFGTPARPKNGLLDPETAAQLGLYDHALVRGSQLYRLQCLHCHGLAGDGRGPTGPWVNPHPRDFRSGKFKFTSSDADTGSRTARRDDISRTIRLGVEGTAMPAFSILPDADVEALTSYVIHLSLRGQTESQWMEQLLKDGKPAPDPDADDEPLTLRRLAALIADLRWISTEKKAIKPGPAADEARLAESVANGQKLFMDKNGAGCVSCHIRYGLEPKYTYDDWGTVVRPANLTVATYRGGRRPVDLYYRIKAGINGSGMPAQKLDPAKIWDLVNFVRILPYPAMREKYNIAIE